MNFILAFLITISGFLNGSSPWFTSPEIETTDLCGAAPTSTVAIGQRHYYNSVRFKVSAPGAYTISNTYNSFRHPRDRTIANDSVLILYTDFNPGRPLNNIVGVNDDRSEDNYKALLLCNLEANKVYTLVTTTFAYGDSGMFTNMIEGPGRIDVLPNPTRTTYPWPLNLIFH